MSVADCTTWECINSFSNWVSAVGTVATAVLALWLSVRDRRINVQADFNSALVPGSNPRVLDQRVFMLAFTNLGPRTVTITNHAWRLPFSRNSFVMFPNVDTTVAHLCSQMPCELSDGKSGRLFYVFDHFKKLENSQTFLFPPNRALAWLRIHFFRIHLATSVGKQVRVRIHRGARRALWSQYRDA